MRARTCLKLGGVIGLIALLSACGGSDNSNGSTPSKPTSYESQFGTAFAAIFDASSTSQPVAATDSSVPALAPAAQPISPPS